MSVRLKKILRGLHKHIALLLLAISIGIVVNTLLNVEAAKDNGKLELIDVEGDRSVMEDVKVGGYIRDGYHEMNFEWGSETVSKETILYEKPRVHPPPYYRGAPLPHGDRAFEIYPGLSGGIGFEIRAWRNNNGFRTNVMGVALAETSLRYVGSADGYSFSNHQEIGLAFIGDRVYYAPPTTGEYKGTSGIYEVLRFGQRQTYQSPDEAETRELVELDMEGNQPEERKGLAILGLEAVDNKLALVALVDGEITIRGYDSSDGAFLGEAALGDYVFMSSGESEPSRGGRYYEDYEAFVDDDIEVLNLIFKSVESDTLETKRMVASISFQDGIKLLNKQVLRYEGSDRSMVGETNRFSYRNGKLYAILVTAVPPEMYTANERLYDKRVFVEVYEAGEKKYRGELVSDINDDLIEDRYFASAYHTQDKSQYREIGGFYIRNAK